LIEDRGCIARNDLVERWMPPNSPKGVSEAPLRSADCDHRSPIKLIFATSRFAGSAEVGSDYDTVRIRMTSRALEGVASRLVAHGVLATGETLPTWTSRFDTLGSAQGTVTNFATGQQAFCHRARSNRRASLGTYTGAREAMSPTDEESPRRHDRRDA
jgi:hypothetical protein